MTRALTSNDVDHASYIQDNAAIPAPQLLPMLVKVLEARGQAVLSPADREGLHPLVVPLSRAAGGDTLTGVLRWPTSAGGDDMPIVEAGPHGLSLLANSCSEYIHRALVEVRRVRYPATTAERIPRSLTPLTTTCRNTGGPDRGRRRPGARGGGPGGEHAIRRRLRQQGSAVGGVSGAEGAKVAPAPVAAAVVVVSGADTPAARFTARRWASSRT